MVPEMIPHKHHWVSVRTDTLPEGNRRYPTGCNRSREATVPSVAGLQQAGPEEGLNLR